MRVGLSRWLSSGRTRKTRQFRTHSLSGSPKDYLRNPVVSATVEPSESLIHALLGTSRLRFKGPGDFEAEYERKDVDNLKREEKHRKKTDKQNH